MITCQNCAKEFDLNDSVNPNGSKACGVTWGPVSECHNGVYIVNGPLSPILDYENVWCPYCRKEQKKRELQ